MQAIGPYKLMKVEGQDGSWLDTLTAWFKYGHPALLAANFGSTTTKLVGICHSKELHPMFERIPSITSDAHPCRKTSQTIR